MTIVQSLSKGYDRAQLFTYVVWQVRADGPYGKPWDGRGVGGTYYWGTGRVRRCRAACASAVAAAGSSVLLPVSRVITAVVIREESGLSGGTEVSGSVVIVLIVLVVVMIV